MAERDNHLNRKEKLFKMVTSATNASKTLLEKLDTWNRFIQNRKDKVEEGSDAVPPLPSVTPLCDDSEHISRRRICSLDSWEEEEAQAGRSSTRHSSVDMDYFDSIRDQGEVNRWKAGSVGYNSLPRNRRSRSVSYHSYSANRRLMSPRTIAERRHNSATPSPPPKSTTPSQAPLSDPISVRRVSSLPKPEHELKRHSSVDAISSSRDLGPRTAGSHRWSQLGKASSNPDPIFPHNQSSGRRGHSLIALDNQMSATVYQSCATWDELDCTRVQRMVEQAGERQAQLVELWRARQTLIEHTMTLFQFKALAQEVCTYVRTCARTCARACLHECVCVCACTVHACMYACVHVQCMRACMRVCGFDE